MVIFGELGLVEAGASSAASIGAVGGAVTAGGGPAGSGPGGSPPSGGPADTRPDFASNILAAEHFAKHAKGVVARSNGRLRAKPGGADVPEFERLSEYRNAARDFHAGAPRPGVLEQTRPGGDLVRFDPSTGYFGIRTQGGVIRTFFRPSGNATQRLEYYRSQF